MTPLRPPAPADHFSSEHSRITDLSENLASLRKVTAIGVVQTEFHATQTTARD